MIRAPPGRHLHQMTPEQHNALDRMPTRERECLRLAGQRLTSKEAALLLQLKPTTVRTLNRRACERLEVGDPRTAAALLAEHEAGDPVVGEWLQRVLTTVSAAAVVVDRARAERALTLDPRTAPAMDDGGAPHGAPRPHSGLRPDHGPALGGWPGDGPPVAEQPGSSARAPGDPVPGRGDAPATGPAAVLALARSTAHDVNLLPVLWSALSAVLLVFGLLGVAGLYFLIRSIQLFHEAPP